MLKIKITNDDTLGLNKKWIRTILLIFGILFTLPSFVQLFCIVVKPAGYEKIMVHLGNNHLQQLGLGILAFITYYAIKNSKPVSSK